MAKRRLYIGDYTLDVDSRLITIPDNIAAERLLVITDITINTIIYNFADPAKGYTQIFYNAETEQTNIVLTADLSALGVTNSDKLQIFIDIDHQEVEFSEAFIDPVNKIRVSNPENLVDTDFEYGTQSSKWETLQTVNNIPTIYSTNGDTSIESIQSIEIFAGSKQVKVTTLTPHGLVIGDPITVQGLSEFLAEGSFIITGVSTSRIFYYEMDQQSNKSGAVNGSYTTIVPSKFFEGSNLQLDEQMGESIKTNLATPSTITIKTQYTHGFDVNTKMYLRNTVGPKELVVSDSTQLALDGRPTVDLLQRIGSSITVDATADTGRVGLLSSAVQSYDWSSTYSLVLSNVAINAVANTITWTAHGLRNNYCLMYSDPIKGRTNGGLVDGYVYYVKVVDANTIQLCTDYGVLTTIVDLTAVSFTLGKPVLNMVYKVEGKNASTKITAFKARNVSTGSANPSSFGSASRSVNFLIGSVASIGTISNVTLNSIFASGDIGASNETVDISIFGQNYLGLGSGSFGYRVGGIGIESGYNTTVNSNITNCVFQSGGFWYVSGFITESSFVLSCTIQLNLSWTAQPAATSNDHSGYDLTSSAWGLGISAPDRIVAFQRRIPDVGTYTTNDDYSYLVNQRANGRYTTAQPAYTYTPVSVGTGEFSLSYAEGGAISYGTTSEIFYAFVKNNTAYRNTIYYPAHGLTDGDTVTIEIPSNTATNSFSFNASSGTTTNLNLASFDAIVAVVDNDVIRIQTTLSPFTNDLAQYPSSFLITKNFPNPSYNTVYIANHKITSSTPALYTATSPIGGLASSTTYLLERYDDSRLYIRQTTLASAASALTASIGGTTYSPTGTNVDVNLSTPLGSVPTTATLTKVEFRGNFSRRDEFVTVTFTDGYEFDVGVVGADSSTWQEDTTWTSKDVSSLLKSVSGGTGITVNFNPSSAVIFNRPRAITGSSDFWQIRFTVVGQAGTLVLTSTGSGQHIFEANNVLGSYDGIYKISAVPTNDTMEFSADFKIPSKTYTFTQTAIDAVNEIITLTTAPTLHYMITGEKVTYNPGTATAMIDIQQDDELYVIVVDDYRISLAASYLDAVSNNPLPLTAGTGTHAITTSNLLKSIKGQGTVSTTLGSKVVTGNGTNFLVNYKRFDEIWMLLNGFMRKYIVDKVLTSEKLELEDTADATAASTSYYYTTQIIPRPDGYNLHKPFDGGIDITAGTSPGSKITRQTRKYFRYQSGKGIQNSFAINFSPAKVVNSLTAAGTTATVATQEVHNLQAGEQIIISEAEVTTGGNFYNGVHTVSTVTDPYTFQYVMGGTPEQTKAAGYTNYSRNGWRDSAIRAGMFDDQNGFFYEYNGQNLYAVRRSSTLQLSGFINTFKASQIITGIDTSFSTQLSINDKIVVRGQSYRVVEVSSDSRIIIQPAYRGVSSSRVKITKTIDTRVPQSAWNLDKCDGSGPTGFILNINKIQMAYADYSWYGAGKIRFGFKDQNGHVKYVHEFKHNNRLFESYFRSGNLPGRYEIENGQNPNTAPTLFHFGTSVIMDGRFDNDKAYLFTSTSKPFVFTNGTTSTFASSAISQIQRVTINGSLVYVYAIPVTEAVATGQTVGIQIRDANNTNVPEGTYITQVKVAGANSLIYLSYPGTTTQPEVGTIASAATFTVGEVSPIDLTRPIPLISLRLAPSVDSGITGAVGERDIINRMQLALKLAGVTTNKNLEAFFILNGLPSNMTFAKVQNPSLSEVIYHNAGDIIQQGTTIYSTKVSNGSIDIDLSELTDMGNSILGGDTVFPAGPDLLTLAIIPQDTSTISGTSPLFCTGKITWTESQA